MKQTPMKKLYRAELKAINRRLAACGKENKAILERHKRQIRAELAMLTREMERLERRRLILKGRLS